MQRLTIILATSLLTLTIVTTADAGLGIGARYSYVRNNGIEDNSGMFGAMVRLRHMMVVGLEGAVDLRNEELNDGSELRTTQLTLSGMLYPLPIVYGLVGAGLYPAEHDTGGEVSKDSKLGYHFGAGIEWPIVPLVKLTGDLRYYIFQYQVEETDVDADGYAISAGVILYLK